MANMASCILPYKDHKILINDRGISRIDCLKAVRSNIYEKKIKQLDKSD